MLRVRMNIGASTVGPGLSTFFFEESGSVAAVLAADAAFDFYTAIAGQMVNYTTFSNEGEVDEIDPATGTLLASYGVAVQSGTGANGGDQLPLGAQGLLRLNTGVILDGRQVRGRLFIPGATEASSTNGRPISDYRAAITGGGDGLLAEAGLTWSVWHRPTAAEPSSGDVVPIASVNTWTEWAVLRSRRD